MTISVDSKFVKLISSRLRNFKQKNVNLWNFSCPFCGDSQKNKTKARGYVFPKENTLLYRCHNCGVSTNAGNLIKQVDSSLYSEYVLERYTTNKSNTAFVKKANTTVVFKSPKFGKVEKQKTFEHAEWVSKLPSGHFCLTYLENRLIPKKYYDELLFTENYKQFIDNLIPNHGKNLFDDTRLVIPFYDEDNELIAVSGRCLEYSSMRNHWFSDQRDILRYITLRTNNSEDKLVYGMNRVNLNDTVYIVEGPFDSMFIDNCVASGDANLTITANNIQANKKVLIFDNEPRNRELCKLIEKAIKNDNFVVIWPDNLEGKDINDMILNDISHTEILDIISNNTFRGVEAIAKFTFWKMI